MGSGKNGELTFLDLITLIGFCVGLENLELNLAQEDLDNQTQELDSKLREAIEDIHKHLAVQDAKLNIILEKLKEKEVNGYDSRRNF